jgi:hypothetical protein
MMPGRVYQMKTLLIVLLLSVASWGQNTKPADYAHNGTTPPASQQCSYRLSNGSSFAAEKCRSGLTEQNAPDSVQLHSVRQEETLTPEQYRTNLGLAAQESEAQPLKVVAPAEKSSLADAIAVANARSDQAAATTLAAPAVEQLSAENVGVGSLLIVFGLCVYLLPTFQAKSKGHLDIGSIAVINIFFGWTVIGWFVALIWACSGNTQSNHGNREISIPRVPPR